MCILWRKSDGLGLNLKKEGGFLCLSWCCVGVSGRSIAFVLCGIYPVPRLLSLVSFRRRRVALYLRLLRLLLGLQGDSFSGSVSFDTPCRLHLGGLDYHRISEYLCLSLTLLHQYLSCWLIARDNSKRYYVGLDNLLCDEIGLVLKLS